MKPSSLSLNLVYNKSFRRRNKGLSEITWSNSENIKQFKMGFHAGEETLVAIFVLDNI